MRVLVFSDDGTITGYGRFSMEVNTRLHGQGIDIMATSMLHNGLLPVMYDGEKLPYWVAPLGLEKWLQHFLQVLNYFQPQIVCIIKDLSYVELLTQAMTPYDIKRVIVTGIDGKPITPRWLDPLKSASSVVSFSQFGVNALAEQGIQATQIAPGIDDSHFQPMDSESRLQLRQRLGIADDTFVLLTVAQNQHRKAIPHMLEGFFRFADTHPNSLFILDMLPEALNGWDIPVLCEHFGWDISKLRFHVDVQELTMAERYNLANAHTVLSHREGWSLPLVEAMACGVVSLAMDWCSGSEICGEGKGVLVKPLDYKTVSTWGNAFDYHPDVNDFSEKLTWLHDHPAECQQIIETGKQWAQTLTWETASQQLHDIFDRVMSE
jgi:glycosyltransferase involved in cell wall biosynthesis